MRSIVEAKHIGTGVPSSRLSRLVAGFLLSVWCIVGSAPSAVADYNAVATAADAFGTMVGRENSGLYFSGDVRGFSAIQAGNVRLGGMYFDLQQGPFSQYQFNTLPNNLSPGSAIRVGLSAISYPFPAPTGIVEFDLRIPGDKQSISTVLQHGPYGGYFAELNTETPLIAEKLSMTLGAGSGKIEAAPREDLDVSIAGSGDVKLLTRPEHIRKSILGSGHITQPDES